MSQPNPHTEMRRLDAEGTAYVVNWVRLHGVAECVIYSNDTPGHAVVAYDDEWLVIDGGCRVRWAHISSIFIVEG
jgi:hypothetical protein